MRYSDKSFEQGFGAGVNCTKIMGDRGAKTKLYSPNMSMHTYQLLEEQQRDDNPDFSHSVPHFPVLVAEG